VQRGAELGAVVGEDAFAVGLELHRHGLAGFHRGVHVETADGEAVGFVLGALEVGEVDGHFVTHFHVVDDFRNDVRTDQGAIDRHLVALLDHLLLATLDRAGVRAVGAAVGAELVADAGLQLVAEIPTA
jgi:hypothetical protein